MNPTKVLKITTLLKVTTALITLFGSAGSMFAAATVWVDMDLGLAGIQSTRSVVPGAPSFPIGLFLDVDAAGLSAYNLSVSYDTAELTVTSAASFAPLGMGLTTAVPLWVPSPLVRRFGAIENTVGSGPVSMNNILIGTIDVFVPFGATDPTPSSADVDYSFEVGFDVFGDGAGTSFTPTFHPGNVMLVPEPSTWAMLGCGVALWLVWRRRFHRFVR
jgi:hypothetical protein